MSDAVHTGLVAALLLATVIFFFLTYVGIDAYMESGRSLYGDARTAIGYQWKDRSCQEVFDGVLPGPLPSLYRDRMIEICGVSRSRGIPPIGLRSVIDAVRSSSPGGWKSQKSAEMTLAFLSGTKAALVRRLPELEDRYGQQARRVSCAWFFFPGLVGSFAVYFYARRFTPVLLDRAKKRFDGLMFGRNRYSDAFESFIGKTNRRPQDPGSPHGPAGKVRETSK